jgi:hypothetical protein
LNVSAGDQLSFSAIGTTTYGADVDPSCTGSPTVDASGQRSLGQTSCPPKYDTSAPVPDAPIGGVIARVGSGAWFSAAPGQPIQASDSGPLYLGYNDPLTSDNTGQYTVSVTTSGGTAAGPPDTDPSPASAADYPHGSATPATDPAATVMPGGMAVVQPGPNVDGICNAIYLAQHPGDTADPAQDPVRVAWLPGQTTLYADDPNAYNTRQVQAPGAAWNWTCGRPGEGLYVTWEQFTWSCQYWHQGVTGVQAWLRDENNAYSWECVAPN